MSLPPFAQTNLQTADWRVSQRQTPSDQIAWLRLRIERCGNSNFHEARSLVPHLQAQLDQLEAEFDDAGLLTTIHALSATHDDDKLADLLLSLAPIERGGAAYQYATYLRETHGIIRTPTFLKKQWNELLER
jgi:hypothetical protein